MKAPFRLSFLLAALVVVIPGGAYAAEPVEAGIDDDAAVDTPLRCDGALCDTTTGGTTCNMAGRFGARGPAPLVPALLLLAAMGVVVARRRSHRTEERTR
jgi:hypothetical protein